MFAIQRQSFDRFSVVVCNSGDGLQYHPSNPEDMPKIKYRTSIRLNDIHEDRISDKAFWAMALSQWLKSPASEYHRVEVLYDVMLPWLAQRLLPEAIAESAADPCAAWRSPQVLALFSFIFSFVL